MAGAFKISDLVWGALNYFKDTLATNSGDPRRDNSRDFINAALLKTYGRDTLESVTGFYGIVMAAMDTYQVDQSEKSSLLTDYAVNPSQPFCDLRTAYKVYIPEMEPSPAPTSQTDPMLWFYPNIFPNRALQLDRMLSPGDLVRVEYRDMQNLIEPTIVSVEGHIPLAFPATKATGLAFKFKAAKNLPHRGDPTGRGAQETATYKATGQKIGNGELQNTGILVHLAGPPDYSSGLHLIQDAAESWGTMKRDFEAKFPGRTLTGTGYRTFEKQAELYECYKNNNCNNGNLAATPGTSNHGWGAAVDINRTQAGISTKSDADMSAPASVWLNKFGKDYGFVFTVGTENWHMDWVLFNDVIEGATVKGVAKFPQEPSSVYASMTKPPAAATA